MKGLLAIRRTYDKITNEFFDIKDSGVTIDMKIVALHGDYEASEIICSSPETKEHKVYPDILEQFEKDILEADSIVGWLGAVFGSAFTKAAQYGEKQTDYYYRCRLCVLFKEAKPCSSFTDRL